MGATFIHFAHTVSIIIVGETASVGTSVYFRLTLFKNGTMLLPAAIPTIYVFQ